MGQCKSKTNALESVLPEEGGEKIKADKKVTSRRKWRKRKGYSLSASMETDLHRTESFGGQPVKTRKGGPILVSYNITNSDNEIFEGTQPPVRHNSCENLNTQFNTAEDDHMHVVRETPLDDNNDDNQAPFNTNGTRNDCLIENTTVSETNSSSYQLEIQETPKIKNQPMAGIKTRVEELEIVTPPSFCLDNLASSGPTQLGKYQPF